MKEVLCDVCQRNVPMNEAFTLGESTACGPCCEKASQPSAVDIHRLVDPTVCRRCSKDGGETTLPLVAGAPVCEECHAFLHHYPFPTWVKAAGAGLVLFVVFAALWNLRFMLAYHEMHASMTALMQGDGDRADALAHAAARHVPESMDLAALASYHDGINSLREDNSTEALASLEKANEYLPPEFGVENLIVQARIGMAFDNQDYDEFLALATKSAAAWPDDATSQAMVASAQACKFATTGDESFRKQALATLEQAKALSADDPDFATYEQRILHRLHSREIIDKDEFQQRFPQGWKEQEVIP